MHTKRSRRESSCTYTRMQERGRMLQCTSQTAIGCFFLTACGAQDLSPRCHDGTPMVCACNRLARLALAAPHVMSTLLCLSHANACQPREASLEGVLFTAPALALAHIEWCEREGVLLAAVGADMVRADRRLGPLQHDCAAAEQRML